MSRYDVKAGLVDVVPFDVVGISVVTDRARATEDLNTLWERFFAERIGQRVENKVGDVIYAVYSDYEGDHTKPYRVTIGYRVAEDFVKESVIDLHHVKCEAGQYAVLSAGGPQPQALIETWQAIWSSDLDRRFQTDFEVYGPRFFEDGVHEVLLHIGITS